MSLPFEPKIPRLTPSLHLLPLPHRCGDNIALSPNPISYTVPKFDLPSWEQLKETTNRLRSLIYTVHNSCPPSSSIFFAVASHLASLFRTAHRFVSSLRWEERD